MAWVNRASGQIQMLNFTTFFPIRIQQQDASWQYDAATDRWSCLVDLNFTNTSTSGGFSTSSPCTGLITVANSGSGIGSGTIKPSGGVSGANYYRSSGGTTRNGVRCRLAAGRISSTLTGTFVFETRTVNLTWSMTVPNSLLNSTLDPISNFTMDSNPFVGEAFNVAARKNNPNFVDRLTIKLGDTIIRTIENFTTSNIEFTNDELDVIYTIMDRVNFATFTFELRTFNGTTQIGVVSTRTATGSINTLGRAPTIDPTVITYEDVNSTILNITGNPLKIIKGHSDLKIEVHDKATPNKNAFIGDNAYRFDSLSKEPQFANHSDILPLTALFEEQNSEEFTVTVIDSRTNQVSISKLVDFVNYDIPIITELDIERENGTNSDIYLTISGVYFNWLGLKTPNLILFGEYRYVEIGSDNWSEWTSFSVTNEDGNFSRARGKILDLDITKRFEFQVRVKDLLEYSEVVSDNISSAEPILALDQKDKKIAIGMITNDNLPPKSVQAKHFFNEEGIEVGKGSDVDLTGFARAKTLFSGSSTGNFTLSEHPNDFDFIDIVYIRDGIRTHRIHNANNWLSIQRTVHLHGGYSSGTPSIYTFYSGLIINGRNVTRGNHGRTYLRNNIAVDAAVTTAFEILKIIGYKWIDSTPLPPPPNPDMVDYKVEEKQYTVGNSIQQVTRWYSGKMEIIGEMNVATAISSVWGGGFINNSGNIVFPNFAIPFVGKIPIVIPFVNHIVAGVGLVSAWIENAPTLTTPCRARLFRGATETTSRTYIVGYKAEGRWK